MTYVLSILLGLLVFIGFAAYAALDRIASAIESQNRHYGIPAKGADDKGLVP